MPNKENEKLHTRNKGINVSIRRKTFRKNLDKNANENITTKINFLKIVRPFLTNKRHLENVLCSLRSNESLN